MKRTVFTVAAMGLFGILLGFTLWGPKGATKQAVSPSESIVALAADAVQQLSISSAKVHWELAKETQADKSQAWVLKKVEGTQSGDLDQAKITSFLTVSAPLQAVKKVADNPNDWSVYGLVTPQWTVSYNGGAVVLEIGDLNQAAGGYYARVQGKNSVYLISSSVGDSLPKDATDWFKQG